jgi:DMSO reductase family type II enzyme chaperone
MSEGLPVLVALRRAALYRLLALAFAEPTPPRLQAVAAAARTAVAEAPAELRDLLHRLAGAAAAADPAALAAEHVVLFQRAVRCPPYEGAYGAPRLAGKAALLADIAGFYRAFGLEPASGQPEVEDHLGAELEFMSVLAFKEAWAIAERQAEGLQITRDAQRAFLADHLAGWGQAFADRVVATATPGFYPAAAALLEAWLAAECARLDVTAPRLEGVSPAEESAFTCPMAPAASAPPDGD